VRVVLGDNESGEVIEREVRNADIVFRKFKVFKRYFDLFRLDLICGGERTDPVYRIVSYSICSCVICPLFGYTPILYYTTLVLVLVDSAGSADDIPGTTSILKAATSTPKASGKPTYYIHISGTASLAHESAEGQSRYGKVYDDWEGLDELLDLPKEAIHRNVDELVLNGSKGFEGVLRTAIVSPPAICGTGRGPVSQRGMMGPFVASSILKRGYGYLPQSTAQWDFIHLHDLTELNLLLVLAAAQEDGGKLKATWNQEGYYLVESERVKWAEYSRDMQQAAVQAGYVADKGEMLVWDMEKAMKEDGMMGAVLFMNSMGRAVRARKLLGWEPKAKSVKDDMPEIIAIEAKALGK
jgi:nucleoside-diphosphate-sugar epimerase